MNKGVSFLWILRFLCAKPHLHIYTFAYFLCVLVSLARRSCSAGGLVFFVQNPIALAIQINQNKEEALRGLFALGGLALLPPALQGSEPQAHAVANYGPYRSQHSGFHYCTPAEGEQHQYGATSRTGPGRPFRGQGAIHPFWFFGCVLCVLPCGSCPSHR
jgi:hypothetical protein